LEDGLEWGLHGGEIGNSARWDHGMWETALSQAREGAEAREEAGYDRQALSGVESVLERPPELITEREQIEAATNASLHEYYTNLRGTDLVSPPVPHPVAPSVARDSRHYPSMIPTGAAAAARVPPGIVPPAMPLGSVSSFATATYSDVPVEATKEEAEETDLDPEGAPEQYLCSITGDLMQDPVATADGHTYERRAIEKWLQRSDTSPMTGLVLPHKELMPIFALKSLIEDFKQKRSCGVGK